MSLYARCMLGCFRDNLAVFMSQGMITMWIALCCKGREGKLHWQAVCMPYTSLCPFHVLLPCLLTPLQAEVPRPSSAIDADYKCVCKFKFMCL